MAENGGELYKKGRVLVVQGTASGDVFMLQDGTIEILTGPREYNGLDQDIVISKSRRAGIISGKTALVGFSRNLNEPYCATFRALTDSTVSRYSLRGGGFRELASSDIGTAVLILRNLYSRLTTSVADSVKYAKLYQNVSRVDDNIALIYMALGMQKASSDLHSTADSMHKLYNARGGRFPQMFDGNFLVADNGKFLNKKYEAPKITADSPEGRRNLEIFKGILKLDAGILKAMFNSDPTIAANIFSAMTDDLLAAIESISAILEYIDNEMTSLFGSAGSWASYLIDSTGLEDWLLTGRVSQDFIRHVLSIVSKISANYDELSGKRSADYFSGIKKLQSYVPRSKEPERSSAGSSFDEPAQMRSPAIHASGDAGALKQSLQQIYEFAVVDKEFQTRFSSLLNDFKKQANPLATEDEPRKLRRQIAKLYWDLYKSVYLRSRTESSTPRSVKFMLNYGFLDETLVDGQMIAELNEITRRREPESDNIFYEEEFIDLIYKQIEEPSITEMGLNYQAHLREIEKSTSKKDKRVDNYEDNVKQVLYEIEQRVTSTCAVCSGSTSTAFPILNSMATKGSLVQMYTSKNKIHQALKEIVNIDYSAFYRETVLKIGEAREIIQEEIIPYIIILPISGSKMLLWQEMSGINKRSRGRIVVPVFFMGDFMKNLAYSIASFRWELNKTIKGGMWADPVEGGISGEYFDYVNTYKKNSRLTQEMKEKITERFKSLRTNRDRFADDYLQWIFNEKDGIMKLNVVVREMFYKHVPFRKEVRDKLEGMPAYTQMSSRYKNISARNYAAYERKFKKYLDAGGYPEEIQNYMNFLKL